MTNSSRVVAVVALLAAAGNSPLAQAVVLDNFEAYRTGTVSAAGDNVTGGTWTTIAGNNATLQNASGNLVLSIGAGGNSHAWRPIPSPIADNATATVYMRVRANALTANGSFGVSDIVAPTTDAFAAFEAQVRVVEEPAASGIIQIDARNAGAFTDLINPININTWYNVWMVVDSTANTYDVYVNTGTANASAGDLLGNDFTFRNGAANTDPLTSFLAYGGAGGVLAASIDDININAGTVLTNFASPPFMPGDVTGNTIVDINDFFPIRNNLFNTGMTRSQGDLSRNGTVGFEDYQEWKSAAFAAGMAVGDLDFGQISALYGVPEPSTACLALVGFAACWQLVRRRGRTA